MMPSSVVSTSWEDLILPCRCCSIDEKGRSITDTLLSSAGAAGNFLASINQLSANAFKSVIDIDVLGSYNTLKATLPYLVESAQKHRVNSDTRKPNQIFRIKSIPAIVY